MLLCPYVSCFFALLLGRSHHYGGDACSESMHIAHSFEWIFLCHQRTEQVKHRKSHVQLQ